MTEESQIVAAARRIRTELRTPLDGERVGGSLARLMDRWRDRGFVARRDTIARLANESCFSRALLDESLDALFAPFNLDSLRKFAGRAVSRAEVGGFVTAGNIAGAGLHELLMTLLAGRGAIVKTATGEPHFFAAFSATLAEFDPQLGKRIAVFKWSRENPALTCALAAASDFIVAYGDDKTIAALDGSCAKRFSFGSRMSIAVLADPALNAAIASTVARDVTLFEQLGCLSPHQIFVEGTELRTREFAVSLARSLEELSAVLSPASPGLEDAAAVRRARETARWRAIAGEALELFEGRRLAWTVIYDPAARLTVAPGFRTVRVSTYAGFSDLSDRLALGRGRIEACAVAGSTELKGSLASLEIPYICEPGAMQSPPLEWRHGGGQFLDYLSAR